MYSHESGKRAHDPDDRAHDHLAAAAVRTCPPDDIAATLRVLEAMRDEEHLRPLLAQMTRDLSGNPITDTPKQQLAQSTWSIAYELGERLRSIIYALRHAAEHGGDSSNDREQPR